MCGIVGMIARKQAGFFHTDMEIFQNMLLIDQLRGTDSTGVFAVDRKKNVGIMKLASHPNHFMACDEWKTMRSHTVQNGTIVIGHNRAATRGNVTSENAHPFHENNIVLVHNGTIRSDHKKMADVEVDSHAVCHAFNEKGAENVIPTIEGAFAFVWWDISKGKLFACRNTERPLNMVYTDDILFFASESWMAEACAERGHKKITKVESLEPYVLYEFGRNGEFTTKKLNAPQVKTTQLTVVRSGGHGSVGTTGKDTTKDFPPHLEHLPFQDSSIFPKGSSILIRLVQGQICKGSDAREYIKYTGKAIEPGKPDHDVVAYSNVPSMQIHEFIGKPVLAKVLNTTTSNCGPSIYVHELTTSPMVQTHGGVLASRQWLHIIDNCKCDTCKASILDEEDEFTMVTPKPSNRYEVTCIDCVQDKLQGEMKNEFEQRRAATLQDRKPVSEEPDDFPFEPTQVKGPETLQ